ncbi:G-protein coupled receptor 1-like isoform X1 [Polypterus senegalus]|uniref:G-protein coupled receptor 1-like isoform X1 n=1 Tax=Polypterus senegalus TaxID=55291 RepID=UPI001964449A|nr:G-protein coupled receptor 1-like isoform X1 [Polypterus senegalus]
MVDSYNSTVAEPGGLTTEVPDGDIEEDINLDSLNIISIVLYSLTFVLGSLGNGLIIWVTGFRMKKTSNTVWFLNLAIADFVFTLFLPFSIVYTALVFHWPFGRFWCKLNSTIMVLNLYSSVFLLTAISFDRCLSVLAAVWAHNHRNVTKIWKACLLLWLVAGIMSAPYFYFREIETEGNSTKCFNKVTSGQHQALTITRFIFGFLIPFMVIITCYSIILWKYSKIRYNKLFRVTVAVIITFFLCWTPFHIFQLLELKVHGDHSPDLHHLLSLGIPISTSLTFLNSCMNPLLYVCMCREFRPILRSTSLLMFEKTFWEDPIIAPLTPLATACNMGKEQTSAMNLEIKTSAADLAANAPDIHQ